jgi:hypothetical protein
LAGRADNTKWTAPILSIRNPIRYPIISMLFHPLTQIEHQTQCHYPYILCDHFPFSCILARQWYNLSKLRVWIGRKVKVRMVRRRVDFYYHPFLPRRRLRPHLT